MTTANAEFASYDALGLADLVRKGETTSAELVESAIEAIEQHNPVLNAVVHKAYDAARKAAKNPVTGPFTGVPFLIKDLSLHVAGMPRTDGTRFQSGDPDRDDDLLTRRYKQAGLVILGKTNTPEFGITGTTESARLGPCRSPWKPDHIAGGSSGGSAAAVAAGLVPVAHASDGLGSIRIPAACCGLVGLKPSRGRVPLGPGHDHDMTVGYGVHHVVARSVRDSAAMLDATAIPDPGDPLQAPPPVDAGEFLSAVSSPPGRLRIAFSDRTPSGRPIDPEVSAQMRNIAETLEDLGHIVEETDLGINYRRMYKASNVVLGANFAADMAERIEAMGREPEPGELEALTRRNWQAGRSLSGIDVGRARRTLNKISREIRTFFETCDLYMSPVLGTPPPRIGYIDPVNLDPADVDKRQAATFPFTPPFNISGQPGISLPLAQSQNGLPIAMMFHARYGEERTLFSLAGQLEQAIPWKDRRPQIWAGRPAA